MRYFDYAAATPLDSEAAQIYVEAATKYYGNTSSLHDIGGTAKDILENCRSEFSAILGVEKEGIFFTSGGSESNFLGIRALLSAKRKEGYHIISSMAEHSSVQSTWNALSSKYEVTLLPYNNKGHVDLDALKQATREDTVLISIQHGNSEIGSLQPIEEIAAWCKENDILLHSDCVHTFGKINIQKVSKLIDSLSLSSHKFYGPKGTGLVYVNPKLAWKSYYPGTSHENGFRPGTVNVPAIAAMTTSAQKINSQREEFYQKAWGLRQTLLSLLSKYKDQITIFSSDGDQQLPHTLALRIHGIEGQWVMLECNRLGFAISTGSACSTGLKSASKTMKAMQIPEKVGKELIRISFGRDTTEQDVTALGDALIQIMKRGN